MQNLFFLRCFIILNLFLYIANRALALPPEDGARGLQLKENKFITFDASAFSEFQGLQALSDRLYRNKKAKGSNCEGDIHHSSGAKFWMGYYSTESGELKKNPSDWPYPNRRRQFKGDDSCVTEWVQRFFALLPVKEQMLDRFIEVKLAQNTAPYQGFYKNGGGGLIPHIDSMGGFLVTVLLDNTFTDGGHMCLYRLGESEFSAYGEPMDEINHFENLPIDFKFAELPGRPGQGYMIDETIENAPYYIAHGNTAFSASPELPRRTVLITRFHKGKS
jgi:hypothetical protein